MCQAGPLRLEPDLPIANPCVDGWIFDETRRIRDCPSGHRSEKVPRGSTDVVFDQEVPELREILDPGAEFLVPVGYKFDPVIDVTDFVRFEFVGVPSELCLRLAG